MTTLPLPQAMTDVQLDDLERDLHVQLACLFEQIRVNRHQYASLERHHRLNHDCTVGTETL